MKAGTLLITVLASAAIGATLGVLFAPDEGTETRRKIVDAKDDYADALKEKFNDYCDTITRKYKNTMEDAEDMIADRKAKFETAKSAVKNAVS